jgi:hypothetical protein
VGVWSRTRLSSRVESCGVVTILGLVVLAMSKSFAPFLGPFTANGLLYDQDHACLDRLSSPASYGLRTWSHLEGFRISVRSISKMPPKAPGQRVADIPHSPPPFHLQLNGTMANFSPRIRIRASHRRPGSHLQAEHPRSSLQIGAAQKAGPHAFLRAPSGPSQHY